MKKTKVEINACDMDLEYARSMWDAGHNVLYHVNQVLKDRGINIEFELNTFDEEEYPEEFWNEEHPEYNSTGVVIKETDDD
ncbi:hypothetical protein DQT32_03490 [Salmonella enterica subsp. enterica serovar Braenderup]|nr:hypothetical protein [Salmonella enterica subsp. enterica serovar Braenderup]